MQRNLLCVAGNLFAVALLGLLCTVPSRTCGNPADVTWSNTLVVFAPLDRNHPAVDVEVLAAVPEMIEVAGTNALPALQLEPTHVDWTPGERIDLAPYIGDTTGDTGYIFAELHSPVAQTIRLGIGADYWIECWINGQPIFDTLDTGNQSGRFSILDHQVEVPLRAGENLLAMRFIRGRSSALLALGDASMFAAERRRQQILYGLNRLPENFEDRLLFPESEQAIITSGWDVDLSLPDADLAKGELVGLQVMPERQMYVNDSGPRTAALDTLNRHFKDEPVKIRLSKFRYPYEDRHLDAIVWTSPPNAGANPLGTIEVRLKDGSGQVLAKHEVAGLSRNGLFFSVGFPPQLEGSDATLEVIWRDGEKEIGRASAPFQVNQATGIERSGRIPVHILNEPGATLRNAPMTTGVPFPHGVLDDASSVRLVDETGVEVPLQTKITARWSRFGPIKWLLCDFTVDLEGEPRTLYLEYAAADARDAFGGVGAQMATGTKGGESFPTIDAGHLRFGPDGVWVDAEGDGNFIQVLDGAALSGAFVEHEDGRVFRPDPATPFVIEESGPVKTVIRRAGWYVTEGSQLPPDDSRFCNYVTRYIIHHDSRVVRIVHTWIFSGDGNSDRISNMGWRFPSHAPLKPDGFLTEFEGGEWLGGSGLVQFDYQRYDHLDKGTRTERAGRTPGVMSGVVDGVRVMFGVKDFWQSFPSELELDPDGFAFYNWPKHNRPASFERPVSRNDAFLNRFAHEGEVLDFRLPDEYAEGVIWSESSSSERHWAEGNPESANAQGIARTEEMFLVFAAADVPVNAVVEVVQGLNDESLRALPDPVWLCASGVFSDVPIHPRDVRNFAEVEHHYDMLVDAPAQWVERYGAYGMWLHGDYPTWDMNLEGRTVSTYRAYRGNHHSWPLRWIPFIRSGEPRFFKLAENATRRMIDANFCHYATEAVDDSVGPDNYRRQGRWDRSLLPWAGRLGPHLRSYSVDCDYMWDTYYLTGFARARDVALLFGELTQHDFTSLSPGSPTPATRQTQGVLTSYLDMYRATFNPWFLDAAYSVAQVHRDLYGDAQDADPYFELNGSEIYGRDCFRGADHAFYAFTGCPEHRRLAMNRALSGSSLFVDARDLQPAARLAAYAWAMTGDEFYRQRLAAALDVFTVKSYDGDIAYYRGVNDGHGLITPALQRDIPKAMAVVAQMEDRPAPLYSRVRMSLDQRGSEDAYHFSLPIDVFVKHHGDGPLKLFVDLTGHLGRSSGPFQYTAHGPDGRVYSGEGEAPQWIEIPGGKGVYRVDVSGRMPYPDGMDRTDPNARRRFHRNWSQILLPFGLPATPEVFGVATGDHGTSVPGRSANADTRQADSHGYWFRVPENVEAFWIEFTQGAGGRFPVNTVSVSNPDGERIWYVTYARDEIPSRTMIEVPEEHRGQLWRASGGSFILDPQIPPYFAVRPEAWFNPEAFVTGP